MVVSVQEVLDYIGLDETDEMTDRNVSSFIDVADSFLKGAVGYDYPQDDPRAKQLALILINDLYENRGAWLKSRQRLNRLSRHPCSSSSSS